MTPIKSGRGMDRNGLRRGPTDRARGRPAAAASDRAYKRVQGFLGDAGTVELIGICGYCAMIAMTLNVFRV